MRSTRRNSDPSLLRCFASFLLILALVDDPAVASRLGTTHDPSATAAFLPLSLSAFQRRCL